MIVYEKLCCYCFSLVLQWMGNRGANIWAALVEWFMRVVSFFRLCPFLLHSLICHKVLWLAYKWIGKNTQHAEKFCSHFAKQWNHFISLLLFKEHENTNKTKTFLHGKNAPQHETNKRSVWTFKGSAIKKAEKGWDLQTHTRAREKWLCD